MRVFVLDRKLIVPRPLQDVFAFFSDPRNLEAITPPWLNFSIDGMSDPSIRKGTNIRYSLRIRGIPLRWTSRISTWEPPYRFVDEQVRGPYRRWVHTHTFEARGNDTVVGDHVSYAPLGGWLADRLIVRADLNRIFQYRSERLLELLGSPDPQSAQADLPAATGGRA